MRRRTEGVRVRRVVRAPLPADWSSSFAASSAGRPLLVACGLAGAAVWGLAVVFIVRSVPADQAVARGAIEFLVIGVTICAGLYAVQMPGNGRFGLALIAAGFAWSLTALGESDESLPYSVGRVAAWMV